MKDVFICHAGEDKNKIVRPLAEAFDEFGISYWVDEGQIAWGHSLTGKVNEGLSKSRYVIVILSEAFLSKPWPEKELNAALNIEASSGVVKVLPLLIGNKETREKIFNRYPLLNDKLYVEWQGSPEPIIQALNVLFSQSGNTESEKKKIEVSLNREIPIPRIRKTFTDFEKDKFLKDAYVEIKNYFQEGLERLESQYTEVNTDFTELSPVACICRIYVNGQGRCGCKIWISNQFSNTIGYFEDTSYNFRNAESYNEMINVDDDGFELTLKFTIGYIGMTSRDECMTPEQAAEKLWTRFVSRLEHRVR